MAGSPGLTNGGQLQLLTSEDGCVLLDIENDRILKLNSVAAEMWTLLSMGQTTSQIAAKLSQKYDASEQRILKDVNALIRRIEDLGAARGSIFPGAPEETSQDRTSHSSFPWYGKCAVESEPMSTITMMLTALLGLVAFDVILSLLSLKALCWCVRTWPIRRRKSDGPDVIGPVCSAVQRACVWYPKRTLCLQRSAVTTCLLRRHGIAARMVIGARSMPLLAHAWVEADGTVVNDWPRVKSLYRSLLSH